MFPEAVWTPFGEHAGENEHEDEEEEEWEEEEASWEPLGALGACWNLPGGLLEALWGLLGPAGSLWRLLEGLFGCLRAFLPCLTTSEAVMVACLGRLGASSVILDRSWGPLGPS